MMFTPTTSSQEIPPEQPVAELPGSVLRNYVSLSELNGFEGILTDVTYPETQSRKFIKVFSVTSHRFQPGDRSSQVWRLAAVEPNAIVMESDRQESDTPDRETHGRHELREAADSIAVVDAGWDQQVRGALRE